MWILYAFLSALFAGITSILAKIGIKNTNSHLATALRTIVVLVFAWIMVFVVGSQATISGISAKSMIFLILSGLSTGASWICYFRALQLGDVNKVVPIDKSSTILTMLLAFIFLGESVTVIKILGMCMIAVGTYLMIQKKQIDQNRATDKKWNQVTDRKWNQVTDRKWNRATDRKWNQVTDKKWMIYAIFSAIFAALTSILGKIGIENVESNLGTAIRTIVVLIMAWIIVFSQGKQHEIKDIDKKSWLFILLSGIATGGSWLFYYKALQEGQAAIVAPIDKLSILITVAFSCFFLKEKLSKKALVGLAIIVFGTLLLLVK
ncbi:MAG: EamA family transporter [Clostridia bacterium]